MPQRIEKRRPMRQLTMHRMRKFSPKQLETTIGRGTKVRTACDSDIADSTASNTTMAISHKNNGVGERDRGSRTAFVDTLVCCGD